MDSNNKIYKFVITCANGMQHHSSRQVSRDKVIEEIRTVEQRDAYLNIIANNEITEMIIGSFIEIDGSLELNTREILTIDNLQSIMGLTDKIKTVQVTDEENVDDETTEQDSNSAVYHELLRTPTDAFVDPSKMEAITHPVYSDDSKTSIITFYFDILFTGRDKFVTFSTRMLYGKGTKFNTAKELFEYMCADFYEFSQKWDTYRYNKIKK